MIFDQPLRSNWPHLVMSIPTTFINLEAIVTNIRRSHCGKTIKSRYLFNRFIQL